MRPAVPVVGESEDIGVPAYRRALSGPKAIPEVAGGLRRQTVSGERPVADRGDRTLGEPTGCLGRDAQFLTDLAVAPAPAIGEAEPLLDGLAGTRVEHVEEALQPPVGLGVHELQLGPRERRR